MNIYFFFFYSPHIPDTISLLYVHPFLLMHSPLSHITPLQLSCLQLCLSPAF
jgi:hypothetical protein